MMMNLNKALLYICFLCYLSLLLYLLFFSAYRQSVEGLVAYNLVPFKTLKEYFLTFEGFSFSDPFVGNILAFLPFGFFMPFLSRGVYTFKRALLSTFSLSLSVEAAQFLFRVGAFDVDDLLLNTIGGGLGYILVLIGTRGQVPRPK